MIRAMRRHWVAALAVACLATSACYDRRVPGPEIRELISDSTVRGRHELDMYSFERHYDPRGTFEQTRGPSGSGRWQVTGDKLCIRWNSPHRKAGRAFCRRVHTDDKGAYWKEFDRRNGNTVKVVTYTSITGPDGTDRRVIPGTLTRWKRWMLTWRGLVVLLLFGIAAWFVLRGKRKPDSFRNRWRRRFFGVRAGERAVRLNELERMDTRELCALVERCIRGDTWVDLPTILAALFDARRTTDEAIAALWETIRPFEDDKAQRAIATSLDHLGNSASAIAATDKDLRFAYLAGKAFAERAEGYQTSNSALFELNKKLALEYFDHVRASAPGPGPAYPDLSADTNPYRESMIPSDTPNYPLLVGAAYESVMYMNYIAPARSSGRSSSSFSGGG